MPKHSYFGNIKDAIATSLKGAQLTLKHFAHAISKPQNPPTNAPDALYFEQHNQGIVTLNYPYEAIPVPDNGRYRLHNEIDDCIVCDKCAKVCPVDCIDIEVVKSAEVIGHTLDGTAKRLYAAKFDIDMAKCCFCGLCTTVCPTECLTMTKTYDFSEFDLASMNYHFATMTEAEVASAQRAYDEAQEAKKQAAMSAKPKQEAPVSETPAEEATASKRPAFRPKAKPAIQDEAPKVEESPESTGVTEEQAKKPAFRPKMKVKEEEAPKAEEPQAPSEEASNEEDKPKKPVFRPKMRVREEEAPKAEEPQAPSEEASNEEDKPKKPVFRPKMKVKEEEAPKAEEPPQAPSEEASGGGEEAEQPKKPVFRPKIRPKKE